MGNNMCLQVWQACFQYNIGANTALSTKISFKLFSGDNGLTTKSEANGFHGRLQ